MASIQGVYVALFGRPADPAGLAYFNGVTNNGTDLAAIANLAGQKEFTDRFAGQTNVQIVNSIYQSLFNRDAETAGLNFFVDKLNKGELNVNNIAIAILDGAQGNDKTIATNKVAAADLFTKSLDTPTEVGSYTGEGANAIARAWLQGVGTTAQTQAQVDAQITAVVNKGAAGVTLLAADVSLASVVSPEATDVKLRTTNLDDTINVAIVANAVAADFTGSISGGFGTDTVVLAATGSAGVGGGTSANVGTGLASAAPTLLSVEKLVVNATGGAGGAAGPDVGGSANVFLSLANATSVNDLTVNSVTGAAGLGAAGGSANVSITDALVGSTLNVNAPGGNVSFGFRDASGASDAATLNLKGAVAAGASVAVNDIETLSIALSGTTVDTIAGSSLKNVTLTGTGGLSDTTALGATTTAFTSTTLKSLDASAVNGSGVSVNVSAATTGVTVTGTKFADTIVLNNTGALATDKDVIVYNSANVSTQSTQDTITNFTAGEDKIDVKAFGLTGGITSVSSFSAAPAAGSSFLGNAAASFFDGANTLVYVDTNNNGSFDLATDLTITLTGNVAVTGAEFIFA